MGKRLLTSATAPLTRIPGTNVTGRVIASEQDQGNDVPLEGVTVRVDGFPDLFAVTDANGDFTLADVPAPDFFVHIDGSTTTLAGGNPLPTDGFYPIVGKPFHSVPGQTVALAMDGQPFDIHLPFILDEAIHPVTPGVEMSVGLPASQTQSDPQLELVSLTVPADSLINDDGTPGTQVGVFKVESDRLPAPLPDGLDHSFDITIQTDAESFDVPAPITFPNLDGLAPGEKTFLMSFDHGQGKWLTVGTMTVDPDGQTVSTDPGVGVEAPGWHGIQRGVLVRGGLVLGARGTLFGRTGGETPVPQTGVHYWAIENLSNNFTIRGKDYVLDRLFDQVMLAANTQYRLTVYGPLSQRQGEVEFTTPGDGDIHHGTADPIGSHRRSPRRRRRGLERRRRIHDRDGG